MSKEIKFRAWVVKGGAMADWETILKECDRFSLLKDQNFIFMQYTGLKDKKGVEIYEGDFVLFDVRAGGTGESKKTGEIGPVSITTNGVEFGTWITHHHNYEVIGNIHETPELYS